jgi:hypothetical protein
VFAARAEKRYAAKFRKKRQRRSFIVEIYSLKIFKRNTFII